MPIYVEKICDMRTLLKYAAIAYLHKTDMPNCPTSLSSNYTMHHNKEPCLQRFLWPDTLFSNHSVKALEDKSSYMSVHIYITQRNLFTC